MVAERQTYNLPGFGLMRVRLFPHAKQVFDFLEQYRHVSWLREIDQLGPIREVLPGAHHTRYEYLMAQLALITELCHLHGSLPAGLSLGRDRNTFGRLTGQGKDPSNGEILMVLCLLGNMGHLQTTFSGERAFLKYLRDNPTLRATFKSGLPKSDRKRFEQVVLEYDLYHANYYLAFFLLNRYRRREHGHEIVTFCQSILRSYIVDRDSNRDQSLAALWRLYRSIRRVTYLALDSHYAPVPFSLDLTSIFFSIEHYLSDVFLEDSTFQDALGRLEGVMRDTVYLGPVTLLNHARVSHEILDRLQSAPGSESTVTQLWRLLDPRGSEGTFQTPTDLAPLPAARDVLQLAYELDPAVALRVLPDPMQWETDARRAVGLRSCLFGAEFDPGKRHLKVAAALTPDLESSLEWKAGLRVCKQVVDFDLGLQVETELPAAQQYRNGLAMLRFLLPIALGRQYEYRIRALPVVTVSPLVWNYGSTKVSGFVEDYREWAADNSFLDADGLNEVAMLRDALRKIDYRGALIAFAGQTEVLQDSGPLAEFDGLVVLLSRQSEGVTLIIVEAKNTLGGHTQSEAQLRDQFMRLQIPEASVTIDHLGNKGAFARVEVATAIGGDEIASGSNDS